MNHSETIAQPATPQMPPEVAKAIAGVMMDIKSLAKNDRNKHGGYDYASVDTFYAAIGPLMAKHGLLIIVDETGYLVRTAENDKKTEWLEVSYLIIIAHSSGAVWDRPIGRTAFVPAGMGAQAFGAAQSYVEKTFMRSLFKVPTGEDDSDSLPQTALPAAHKKNSPPISEADKFADKVLAEIKACANMAEIDAVCAANTKGMVRLKEVAGKRWNEISDAISAMGDKWRFPPDSPAVIKPGELKPGMENFNYGESPFKPE